MAVLKKLENKIKLVLIITSLFLIGCVVISLGSLFVARGMVADAHKKIYVLDGTVPILVKQTTMDETLKWKQRAMWKCSIISSLHWLPMISILIIPSRKPCTL